MKGNNKLKKNSKKLKAIVLLMILAIISIVVIAIMSRTYVLKLYVHDEVDNPDDIIVEIEDENIVTCVDKRINGDKIEIELKSKSKGKTFVNVYNKDEFENLFPIYVHPFGIITYNEFMGDFGGSLIIPISITIWLAYVLYLLIVTYRKNVKENLYQYKNIALMGMMVFISFTILDQLLELSHYRGLINTINGLLNMSSMSMFLLPVAFVTSILVIISNLVLVKREGFNLRNILGVLLGAFLCITSMLPGWMYKALNNSTIIDIHGQNGMGVYIYNLMESIIYITITYIECILIGTIVVGFKAARKIPDFNKDYIIILGCQIRRDGTLTKLLQGRVDRAIDFGKMQKDNNGKEIVYVASGGKGNDEIISEAQAMKNYMVEQGIDQKEIIIEDKSKNTYENIKNSIKIINEKKKNAQIAFSTTNYHVFRSGVIANQQGIDVEGMGSKTKWYFYTNALIREFIANLVQERKKHLLLILMINISLFILIAIGRYYNFITL